jgi:hypothetical protein
MKIRDLEQLPAHKKCSVNLVIIAVISFLFGNSHATSFQHEHRDPTTHRFGLAYSPNILGKSWS